LLLLEGSASIRFTLSGKPNREGWRKARAI
jgi:hypothetical protein